MSNISVRYLVIAGGGSGGKYGVNVSGGGGAGGYIENTNIFNTNTQYAIVIGDGGMNGDNGKNSMFSNIIAIGGGAGGNTRNGQNGGSGGGGGSRPNSYDYPKIGFKNIIYKYLGNQEINFNIDLLQNGSSYINSGGSGIVGQGYGGGTGQHLPGVWEGGGGGGGAGGPGISTNGTTQVISHGGPGLASDITGTSIYRAGGGGGGLCCELLSSGGVGGGGRGGSDVIGGGDYDGGDGINNTGSGGGGTRLPTATPGKGGKGIVILRFSSIFNFTIIGNLIFSSSTVSDDTVLSFTSGAGSIIWT